MDALLIPLILSVFTKALAAPPPRGPVRDYCLAAVCTVCVFTLVEVFFLRHPPARCTQSAR